MLSVRRTAALGGGSMQKALRAAYFRQLIPGANYKQR